MVRICKRYQRSKYNFLFLSVHVFVGSSISSKIAALLKSLHRFYVPYMAEIL